MVGKHCCNFRKNVCPTAEKDVSLWQTKKTLKKLLSLPPNVVAQFHNVSGRSAEEYFCTSDPVDQKLGSGGGTTWLLEAAHQAEATKEMDFSTWLGQEKRILLHAGGQSRRLSPCFDGLVDNASTKRCSTCSCPSTNASWRPHPIRSTP